MSVGDMQNGQGHTRQEGGSCIIYTLSQIDKKPAARCEARWGFITQMEGGGFTQALMRGAPGLV